MVENPLVEALEPRREERQRGLVRKLLDERLVELAAAGAERDDPVLERAAVRGVKRGRDDVDPQHHSRPAAVGLVVDLPCTERRRLAIVEHPQLELVAEDGGDRAPLPQPLKSVGYEREDVDSHPASP